MSQETRNAAYTAGTALLTVLATAGFISTNLIQALTALLGAGLTLLATVHSTSRFEVTKTAKSNKEGTE